MLGSAAICAAEPFDRGDSILKNAFHGIPFNIKFCCHGTKHNNYTSVQFISVFLSLASASRNENRSSFIVPMLRILDWTDALKLREVGLMSGEYV